MNEPRSTKPVGDPDGDPDGSRTGDNATSYALAHPLRVRWAEADMQGVVFNAHYLAWFDIGVTEYLRLLAGGDSAWLGDTFDRLYVVKSVVEYRSPARFDDELEVCARCLRVGRSSIEIGFAIRRGGAVLVTGTNVYVYTDASRPAPVPDDLRRRIDRVEGT